MKKQLIAIGLAGVLTVPSVALAQDVAEEVPSYAPPSVVVYGSFRTGVQFKSGEGASDAGVIDFGSRFGLKGSSEVSEGLTASFKLENGFDTATATIGTKGRIGMVGLSGGFGSIALGKMWTASYNHFGAVVNPTWKYGANGGETFREERMVSYSSSVGAVSFQIDRHTIPGGPATMEFGASTSAGPVNIGFGYWNQEDDEDAGTAKSSFTGFAVSSKLAGMNLAIGVGSVDHGIPDHPDTEADESQTDTSIVALSGKIGDSGVAYVVQMSNADKVSTFGDDKKVDGTDDPGQAVVSITSSLGGSASMVFEHVSHDGASKDASLIGLMVNF